MIIQNQFLSVNFKDFPGVWYFMVLQGNAIYMQDLKAWVVNPDKKKVLKMNWKWRKNNNETEFHRCDLISWARPMDLCVDCQWGDSWFPNSIDNLP